ncbi:MAG: Ig-like domain-containing protein [Phycisphaerae bacterium]|nr:Ig-like domain-containing protein [Phycisphaerae bacterium]
MLSAPCAAAAAAYWIICAGCCFETCNTECNEACPLVFRDACCDTTKDGPCKTCQGDGGASGGENRCDDTPAASDPNEKLGEARFGAERWSTATSAIGFSVFFENVPGATAAAARVDIHDPLDTWLNPGTFRVGDIYIGDLVIDVPEDRISYQTTLDLTATQGVLVDILAGVDASKDPPEAFWIFQSIDPSTGEPPTDAYSGFLPPNDASGQGEGRVEFSIRPKLSTPQGTLVFNDAEIFFDANPSIITNEVFNTIDPILPIGSLAKLPPTVRGPAITLAPSGFDPPGGSGLAGFNMLVSIDGSGLVPFAFQPATESVSVYNGQAGRVYGFATRAQDNAGNSQLAPAGPMTVTTIPSVAIATESDSGVKGDGVTNDPTPALLVVGAPLSSVDLHLEGNGQALDASVPTGVNGRGVYEVLSSKTLPDGVYAVTATSFGVVASLELRIDTTPPAIVAWESVAMHGAVGDAAISLPASGASESRAVDPLRLRVRFAPSEASDFAALQPTGLAIVGVDAQGAPIDTSGVQVTISPLADGLTYELKTSAALPDRAVYCLTLTGVADIAGNPPAADQSRRSLALLRGDASADRRVNVTDVGGVIAYLGTTAIDPTNAAQVRCDFDHDGDIDGDPNGPAADSDLKAVLVASGVDLRAIADPCPPVAPLIAGGDQKTGGGSGTGAEQPTHGIKVAGPGAGGGHGTTDDPSSIDDEGTSTLTDPWFGPNSTLVVDHRRLAVFDPFGRIDLARLLPVIDASDATIEVWPVHGWSIVTFGIDRDEAAWERTSSLLVDAGAFVSPVYLGERSLPVVPTANVLVWNQDGVPTEVTAALLLTVDPGATTIRLDEGAASAVLSVTLSTRLGVEAVRMAERIASLPGVRMAEPDALIGALPLMTAEPLAGRRPTATPQQIRGGATIGLLADGLDAVDFDLPVRFSADVTDAATTGFDGAVGTALASIAIGAEDPAVARPDLDLVSVRTFVMLPDGETWIPRTSWLVRAIGILERERANVVITPALLGLGSAAIEAAYLESARSGILHLAPLGEAMPDVPEAFPARLDSVVPVAALDERDQIASASAPAGTRGICALGVAKRALDRRGPDGFSRGDYVHVEGTAVAAARSAGRIALLAIGQRHHDPRALRRLAAERARDLGAPGPDDRFGKGEVGVVATSAGATTSTPASQRADE